MTAEGTMDEVIGKLELESPASNEVAASVVSKHIGVAVGERVLLHDAAGETAMGTDDGGSVPALREDVGRMQLQLDELTAQLAELASQSAELASQSPRPLPVPLFIALEAVLIVALQLADALPLCAGLLSASFVAHHMSALVGLMLLPFCLVLAALLNMLATVALKWTVLGRVRPGTYPLHGWFHLRYWFVESRLHGHDLLLSHFLVGTPLYSAWLRLLGAHIGEGASVDTLGVGAALDLLTIGAGANVGARSISCHHVPRSGVMVIAPVAVGASAMVGPQSIVIPGASIGEATVVGACCVVEQALPSHTFWAGRPLQQVLTDPLEGVTFVRPTPEQDEAPANHTADPPTVLSAILPRRRINAFGAKLVALRPLLSLSLAAWLGTTSVAVFVFGALVYFPRSWLTTAGWNTWGVVLILTSSCAWVWQSGMLLLGLLLKWLLVGKRRPGERTCRYPLCEAACSTYFSILADLIGPRPFILMPPSLTNLYLRLCGAVIGRRVVVHDPLRRVFQADLLRLAHGSFLQASTKLTLQLPVRGETALGSRVKASIFDLGKARFSSRHRAHTSTLSFYARIQVLVCARIATGGFHLSLVHCCVLARRRSGGSPELLFTKHLRAAA